MKHKNPVDPVNPVNFLSNGKYDNRKKGLKWEI